MQCTIEAVRNASHGTYVLSAESLQHSMGYLNSADNAYEDSDVWIGHTHLLNRYKLYKAARKKLAQHKNFLTTEISL